MTLNPITSRLLCDVPHGFFTRQGGVSKGIYNSLNCGAGSDDDAQAVQNNRIHVAEHMQVHPDHLISLHQVHSADVVHVTKPLATKPKADAMVTATSGLALGVLTADCQPVLFADQTNGVIGAAHAGWRGAFDGVLEATVDAMVAIGAVQQSITAVIGPSISQSNYEVGPELLDMFLKQDTSHTQFFSAGSGDRQQFDLQSYSLNRLRQLELQAYEWIGGCTYQGSDKFFSYRRATHHAESDYGRLISAIALPF